GRGGLPLFIAELLSLFRVFRRKPLHIWSVVRSRYKCGGDSDGRARASPNGRSSGRHRSFLDHDFYLFSDLLLPRRALAHGRTSAVSTIAQRRLHRVVGGGRSWFVGVSLFSRAAVRPPIRARRSFAEILAGDDRRVFCSRVR